MTLGDIETHMKDEGSIATTNFILNTLANNINIEKHPMKLLPTATISFFLLAGLSKQLTSGYQP